MAPLVLAGWAFIIYLTARDYHDLLRFSSEFNWAAIASAVMLLVIYQIGTASLFACYASVQQSHARTVAGIYLVGQIGKYIPGKIWSLVIQKLMAGEKINASRLLFANAAVLSLSILTVLCIALAFYAASAASSEIATLMAGLLICVVLTGLFSRMTWTGQTFFLGWIHQRFHRGSQPAPASGCPASLALVAMLTGTYAFGWLTLLHLGFQINLDASLLLVALLSASQVAGIISLLPAGIGVREVVLLYIGPLAGLHWEMLPALAVATRIVLLAVDGLSVPAGFILFLKTQPQPGAK